MSAFPDISAYVDAELARRRRSADVAGVCTLIEVPVAMWGDVRRETDRALGRGGWGERFCVGPHWIYEVDRDGDVWSHRDDWAGNGDGFSVWHLRSIWRDRQESDKLRRLGDESAAVLSMLSIVEQTIHAFVVVDAVAWLWLGGPAPERTPRIRYRG